MSQKVLLDYIAEYGNVHGITLGRGRPHDQRIIQKLVDRGLIVPIFGSTTEFDLVSQATSVGSDGDWKITPRGEVLDYGIHRKRSLIDVARNLPDDIREDCYVNARDTIVEQGLTHIESPALDVIIASIAIDTADFV